MSDYIRRSDAIKAVRKVVIDADAVEALKALPSADAEPKWNCTANFVAEQLDRLRNMTDEERWDFFIKFFSPSADRPTEDYSDLPDIPRAYYEKIVGNMSHEINMLKEQLESADAVQGEWIIHGEPPWYVRECSKCGTKWHQWSGDSNPNFCGHCGARMENKE